MRTPPKKFRLKVRLHSLNQNAPRTKDAPGTALLIARTSKDQAKSSPPAYPPVPYCFCDFLLACRYAYYCCGQSIVTDAQYDSLEEHYVTQQLYNAPGEERGHQLRYGGSDKPADYLPHERSLALYFIFRFAKREQPQPKRRKFRLAKRQ